MKERFPFRITPEFIARYNANLAERAYLNNLMMEGTIQDDLKTGLAMGIGEGRQFCERAYDCGVKFPNLVDEDAPFPIEAFKTKHDFDGFWHGNRTTRATLRDQDDAIESLYGRDMMDEAHYIKGMMDGKKDLPKYKADYDHFTKMYTDRAATAQETKKTNALLSEAEKIIATKKE